MLQVANDRGQCCHVGGDIDFDAAGNLYLTTGDDTNPFESAGYTPIDERTNRNPQFDAQRSLRQHERPARQGAADQAAGRRHVHDPVRQPVRAGHGEHPPGDLRDGFPQPVPDERRQGDRHRLPRRLRPGRRAAPTPTAARAARSSSTGSPAPGNYGWPYCTGTQHHQRRRTTTSPSRPGRRGAKYNCAGGPTNNSFRNTGLQHAAARRSRPGSGTAATPARRRSSAAAPSRRWAARSTGTTPNLNSAVKFPQSLDGRFFAGEYGRRWIKAIEVNGDGSVGEISAFPWTGTQVMDMAFGPDGALYVLDYGTGSNNQALYRIEYIGGGNRSPIAVASANPTSGPDAADRQLLLGRQLRPRGRRADLPVDLRRRHHVDGGQPDEDVHHQRHLHADADGHRPDRACPARRAWSITVGNTAPTVTLTVAGRRRSCSPSVTRCRSR